MNFANKPKKTITRSIKYFQKNRSETFSSYQTSFAEINGLKEMLSTLVWLNTVLTKKKEGYLDIKYIISKHGIDAENKSKELLSEFKKYSTTAYRLKKIFDDNSKLFIKQENKKSINDESVKISDNLVTENENDILPERYVDTSTKKICKKNGLKGELDTNMFEFCKQTKEDDYEVSSIFQKNRSETFSSYQTSFVEINGLKEMLSTLVWLNTVLTKKKKVT